MTSHSKNISNKSLEILSHSRSGVFLLMAFAVSFLTLSNNGHNRFIRNYRRLDSQENQSSIPPVISNNLANVMEPLGLTDTALFWHIPKSGGTTMQEFVSCIGLCTANQEGGMYGHNNDKYIATFQPWDDYHTFVNVDTTTIPGLQDAKSRNFAQSLLADIVITSYLYEAADIFSPDFKGRVSALFRHPIERAASLFYYLQDATWEPYYAPEMKNWSIEQYVQSDHYARNWMMYMLLHNNKLATHDYEKDLELAKTMLKDFFLIGLTSNMEESLDRFDKYYDFDDGTGVTKMCSSELLTKGHGKNVHNHPKLVPGSDDWNILASVNEWDIKLYEYAVDLFEEQGNFFVGDK